ncbi:MAG TPA: hypothetical protein PLL30_16955 [Candidatus Krumholzibacteria bacterium]|nr:hypothetical protein [Verrucomicrobiota bacterium]HPD73464.1 hypothetical protein [Candidatus Krumholzibacteria bacterium]HRY42187.1 hypothetical protein [Candidatus Krumholzibacteria bacterium]
MNHTPGPWQVMSGDVRDASRAALLTTPRRSISQIGSSNWDARIAEDHANLVLAAAAPDLLAALREIVAQDGYNGFGDPASRATYIESVARAAIAKVEGKL